MSPGMLLTVSMPDGRSYNENLCTRFVLHTSCPSDSEAACSIRCGRPFRDHNGRQGGECGSVQWM